MKSQQGIEKSLLNLYAHRKHAPTAVWHMIHENVECRSKVPKVSINLTLFRLVSCRNTEVIFILFFVGDIKIQHLAKKVFTPWLAPLMSSQWRETSWMLVYSADLVQ